MVVRPDGKIGLCSNDAFGQVTLGDLTSDSISDVWNSDLVLGSEAKSWRRTEKLFFVQEL